MLDEQLHAAVYGDLYNSAERQMRAIDAAIANRENVGFESAEECARWAHDFHLDIIAYLKASKNFFSVTERGAVLVQRAWVNAYCNDVLYYTDEKGRRVKWVPQGQRYFRNARIASEVSDGVYEPLYHRDYFTPTGFYDDVYGTFNVAKPFPVFAKETGRDTSHIYEFINHVAGECAPWLLAWLRAKILYPKQKTQVVPIFVSRAQGTGKSTFAEVLCKGLFGKDNVLVTDQYDSTSRFNADYADALIVCHEEKEEVDRRNPAASIKSRATATQIRKENKGLDPIYQDSYTEFIMTTNKDVPIKFDDREDQRRFMIMEADPAFTRKTSQLADEVFTKLYGADADMRKVGVPFNEDNALIAQFKHELVTRKDLEGVKLREFPKTSAYNRCFTLPRTTENTEIESIVRSVAPFIRAMLKAKKQITEITLENGDVISLESIVPTVNAIQYSAALNCVIVCRPIVFSDAFSNHKPYQHAVVERTLYDMESYFVLEYGMRLLPDMSPVPGGFYGIQGKNRNAPAARFCLAEDYVVNTRGSARNPDPVAFDIRKETKNNREGERLRVNGRWRPDPKGEFETVNELKAGVETLQDKTQNVQYKDTFLFESDEASPMIHQIEQSRIEEWKSSGSKAPIEARVLFFERLRLQLSEARRLYNAGIAWRVVYSGSKSYHILVRLKDAPDTLDQYKWLHAHLATVLSNKLVFDASTSDPARLTRAPIVFERMSEYDGVAVHGVQKLVHINENSVYDYAWRELYEQWVNRPLTKYEAKHGKKMLPTREEYRDAAHALLDGTFWTDSKWNGRRQQCFFPGYRLCRHLGYSHDELWDESGILQGVNSYYKQGEIRYWRSREYCDLVQKIDADYEEVDDERNQDGT